jgi:hypothetical protein
MCDWLTFTTWRKDGFDYLKDSCWWAGEEKDEVRMNYKGVRCGKVFIGDGVQNGHWHRMVQVSGADADGVLPIILADNNWTCTQLDLQVTCDWPDAPLFELTRELVRIHGDRKPQYLPSETGCTVYFGSWKSEKLIRIYHKSRRLVRFEVKFKKNYSEHMARTMIGLSDTERRDYIKAWLRWELNRLNSPMLYNVFNDSLSIDPLKPVRMVNREESDRERWIRKVVIPVLAKYANSHDCDPYLLGFISQIVNKENQDELQE